MDCPRCDAAMAQVDETWRCEHGRFIPAQVLSQRYQGAKRRALRADRNLPGPGCPSCRAMMWVVHTGGVDVDVCPSCDGVWLDEGEEAVLRGRSDRGDARFGVSDLLGWMGDILFWLA